HFGGLANNRIVGCIINKVGAPLDEHGQLRPDLTEMFNPDSPSELVLCDRDVVQVLTQSSLPVLGCIPWNPELVSPRAVDLARHLNATILNEGELYTRRLKTVVFCARALYNQTNLYRPNSLLVTSGDRADV